MPPSMSGRMIRIRPSSSPTHRSLRMRLGSDPLSVRHAATNSLDPSATVRAVGAAETSEVGAAGVSEERGRRVRGGRGRSSGAARLAATAGEHAPQGRTTRPSRDSSQGAWSPRCIHKSRTWRASRDGHCRVALAGRSRRDAVNGLGRGNPPGRVMKWRERNLLARCKSAMPPERSRC